MQQPVPKVSLDDVLRIVRRDYHQYEYSEIMNILDQYPGQELGTARVHLAALKNAGGDINELRIQIDIANKDYRDVLACAEYPGYLKNYHLPEREKEPIIVADWNQYMTLLKATEPQHR